jgi:hypothetical protein
MTREDLQAAIRRNLRSKRKLASVKRKRSFDVNLTDRTASAHPFELETFREFHRSTLRPFLEKMLKRRVFHYDDSGLPDELRERRQAKLERIGARPVQWRTAYTKGSKSICC